MPLRESARGLYRILVTDDDAAVREQLCLLLESRERFQVCGEAESGTEAIERTKELHPDLVILDVSMPGVDGFETARVIRRFFPDVRILMFSVNKSNDLMKQVLHLGAAGYVNKSEGCQLLKAIETVLQDMRYSGSTAAYA